MVAAAEPKATPLPPASAHPQVPNSIARSALSDVELNILRLIAEGKTNREIAEQTYFTEKTIRNYVSAVLAKLKLRNRAEAAAYAVRHNLLRGE